MYCWQGNGEEMAAAGNQSILFPVTKATTTPSVRQDLGSNVTMNESSPNTISVTNNSQTASRTPGIEIHRTLKGTSFETSSDLDSLHSSRSAYGNVLQSKGSSKHATKYVTKEKLHSRSLIIENTNIIRPKVQYEGFNSDKNLLGTRINIIPSKSRSLSFAHTEQPSESYNKNFESKFVTALKNNQTGSPRLKEKLTHTRTTKSGKLIERTRSTSQKHKNGANDIWFEIGDDHPLDGIDEEIMKISEDLPNESPEGEEAQESYEIQCEDYQHLSPGNDLRKK